MISEPSLSRPSVESASRRSVEFPAPSVPAASDTRVTGRAFVLGLFLAVGLAGLNAWIETCLNVHFIGGIQMPLGALFSLGVLVLFVNGPLRMLRRFTKGRFFKPFSPAELMTMYVMMMFAALISTPGCESMFITAGASLSYFSTRENGWADLFYRYVPSHFAPGWDGRTFQSQVIDPLYMGGLSWNEVPWHAWTAMLTGWGIFLLLIYATLFFISLLLRRQWIESEALSFPLVQIPLQMVDVSKEEAPPGREFWGNRTMWMGFGLSLFFLALRGLNNYYPDWPQIPSFQGNAFRIEFTENPWSILGQVPIEFFFGGIGIAYLLTREMSFSFWVFLLIYKLQLVGATMLGFPPATLPQDTLNKPAFLMWQGTGGWVMMGLLLMWSARGHLGQMGRSALSGSNTEEPFSPRFMLGGLALSVVGLLGWCAFSGINLLGAISFFGLYILTSIVIARLVVEGGFLFPQNTFAAVEVLNGSLISAQSLGAASLTRLSFMQSVLFFDMRTNLLPGFLQALKIASEIKMSRRDTRRLMLSVAIAVVVTLCVSTFVTIASLYSTGGLAAYSWFTQSAPQATFRGAATALAKNPYPTPSNWGWMATGAAFVWFMTFARARFMWFPLHPIAFLISSGYPMTRLWPSFLIGWACKTLFLRFGGQDWAHRARPFFIGLILGNVTGMMLWMIYGFYAGTQIQFWPA